MIILIAIITGFIVGRLLGYIIDKNTKWIDGKQDVNDYMSKKYADDWKLNK
jgi:hypothetical protein